MTKLYTFRCPVCAKHFTHDAPHEPMCTGPSETRDDHMPIVMRLVRVREHRVERSVHPLIGQARADGPLILPAR